MIRNITIKDNLDNWPDERITIVTKDLRAHLDVARHKYYKKERKACHEIYREKDQNQKQY